MGKQRYTTDEIIHKIWKANVVALSRAALLSCGWKAYVEYGGSVGEVGLVWSGWLGVRLRR